MGTLRQLLSGAFGQELELSVSPYLSLECAMFFNERFSDCCIARR